MAALTSRSLLLFIFLLAISARQIQGIISFDLKSIISMNYLGLFFGQWCLGAHQEYLTCGSACPLACNDVRQARYYKPCTYQCIQGCFCKRGYARRTHPRSQCIPDWRC